MNVGNFFDDCNDLSSNPSKILLNSLNFFLGFKDLKRNCKLFFENIEHLLYSNTLENMSFTLEDLKNYIKICDEKINNINLFQYLTNKCIIILALINSFVLKTTFLDSLTISEDSISEIMSLKGNIIANAFQIIELNHCFINSKQNNSKSLVKLNYLIFLNVDSLFFRK